MKEKMGMDRRVGFGDLSLGLKILVVFGWIALVWSVLIFAAGFLLGVYSAV